MPFFTLLNLAIKGRKYYDRLRSYKLSLYAAVLRNLGKYLLSSLKVGLEHHERENGPDADLEIVDGT